MDGGTKVVRLRGELDQHMAERLRGELDAMIERERPRCLILDLSGVGMMDSSGIGLVIGRYKRVKSYGGRVCVRGVRSGVDRVFAMSGIYRIVERI